MENEQTTCRRCGECCLSGGPALHAEDLDLIREGAIPLDRLITIRKGELVRHPLRKNLQSVRQEMVKVTGAGKEWNCCYYDRENNGCSVYDKRPKACRVLKCWDTEEIEKLMGQDLLSRFDLIEAGDPLLPFVKEHEKVFPCPDMGKLEKQGVADSLEDLEELINAELRYRTKVVQHFNLSVGKEMFYFGRPLFHLLAAIGVRVFEQDNRLQIKPGGSCD